MKKTVSLLLALVLLVSALCLPVSAGYFAESTDYIQGGTTAFDLGAYGMKKDSAEHEYSMLHYYAYKVSTAPTIDGKISTGEYPANSNKATMNHGLYVTDKDYSVDSTESMKASYGSASLETYISYDAKYAYIAEKLVLPSKISTNIKADLALGLNQSDALPEAYSSLSNTYSITVSGNNLTVGTPTNLVRTIHSLTEADVQKKVSNKPNEYLTIDEQKWNPVGYRDNTKATYELIGSDHTYVFEFKIPLEDAIRSQSEYSVSELLAKGIFNGTFAFRISVDATNYIASGTSVNRIIHPYITNSAAPDTTWGKAISEYWVATGDGSSAMDYIPNGVWFAGTYNPSNPYVVTTSKLVIPKPSTGVAISANLGVKIGDQYKFKAIGDGIDNDEILTGAKRIVPLKWELRVNNTKVKQKGTFDSNYEAVIDTTQLSPGRHIIAVQYVEQIFNGSDWVDTKNTMSKTRTFTINGTVKAASDDEDDDNGGKKSPQTGDKLTIIAIASGAMLIAAGAFTGAYVFKKKKAE